MALASQAAFQSDGAFQLAHERGFQTQLFNIWDPIEPPASGGPWVPTTKPSGPWTPVTRPSGPWVPTGG